ncbi:MAG: RNA 2',3'-cyclic phosphodiesterase [Gammaproteobacteria bacterium]
MAERTRRLFFALWPDSAVRTRCDWYSSGLLGKRVRRVPADNLHLTLAFVGSVNDAVSRCLEAHADRIAIDPFRLQIDHLGYWHRPRLLWMGPTHTPDGLWALVTAIRDAFEDCGLQRERRAFQAHMTLARKFSAPLPMAQAPAIDWEVGSFCLVQSINAENGVSYRVLRCWTLEGA